MAKVRIFGVHRTWEDWAPMLLGVVIALTPWPAEPVYLGCPTTTDVVGNAMLAGIAVSVLGAVELVNLHRWEQIGEMFCGVWLIVSPFNFGYAAGGRLRYWHYGLGAEVLLLAVIELRQNWNLNNRQLAHHGT